ncbi:MAG: hypothetical protein M3Z28_14765 [Candidatus Dormibacteraeota bacterium]|nr:hypothetical protein [Candidatus Dormibacteraeota bacterium]
MSGPNRPVERVTTLVPELSAQPEWISQHAWYAAQKFEFSEMDASVLCNQIVGPYLARCLVRHDTDQAGRVMLFLEELLSQQDPAGLLAGRHTFEWFVFRRRLDPVAEPLMGAYSRDFIQSLRAAWSPWLPLVDVLDSLFRDVSTVVLARHPSLKAGGSPLVNSAGCAFHYGYSFMYEPASQRYEDLLLEFAVGLSDLAATTLAAEGRQETAVYNIERGSGRALAPPLGPIVLPARGSGSRYFAAVLEAAQQAAAHTWRHLDDVLPALATPYDVEN